MAHATAENYDERRLLEDATVTQESLTFVQNDRIFMQAEF
jgi:hypothetical protein